MHSFTLRAMSMRPGLQAASWAGVVAMLGGCASGGRSDSEVPWEPNSAVVVGPTVQTRDYAAGDGSCIVGPDGIEGDCYEPFGTCESGGAADVVVDAEGRLLDVVCYPAKVDGIERLVDGRLPQNANGAAIVIEDGIFEGDLHVDGNRFVLWGAGPDVATLDGNLTLSGNNAIVRGVAITGDVDVTLNNAIFVYCVIHGDLHLRMNNARVSGCDIYGDVLVYGNNVELNGNRIQGSLDVRGGGTECHGNYAFTDADDNGSIDADELGDDLTC